MMTGQARYSLSTRAMKRLKLDRACDNYQIELVVINATKGGRTRLTGAEDMAEHVLFDCSYRETWSTRTETAAANTGLRWPRNVTEINDSETAEWWTFYGEAAEKNEQLLHDN
ncbi:hypothetical protein Trydic_g8337 [Trypoxylus dichotomus]